MLNKQIVDDGQIDFRYLLESFKEEGEGERDNFCNPCFPLPLFQSSRVDYHFNLKFWFFFLALLINFISIIY